jgi:hypothetical protein
MICGKVYKIFSENPDIQQVYIGSTIQKLRHRFTDHKSDMKRSNCSFKIIYELDPECKIELIEDYGVEVGCSRKDFINFLRQRESYYQKFYKKLGLLVNNKSAFGIDIEKARANAREKYKKTIEDRSKKKELTMTK